MPGRQGLPRKSWPCRPPAARKLFLGLPVQYPAAPIAPPFLLRSSSVPPPFHLRSSSVQETEVLPRYNGGRTEVERWCEGTATGAAPGAYGVQSTDFARDKEQIRSFQAAGVRRERRECQVFEDSSTLTWSGALSQPRLAQHAPAQRVSRRAVIEGNFRRSAGPSRAEAIKVLAGAPFGAVTSCGIGKRAPRTGQTSPQSCRAAHPLSAAPRRSPCRRPRRGFPAASR